MKFPKKKLRRLGGIYLTAALVTLSVLSAVFFSHLQAYRTAAEYGCSLAFEQTAASVQALSEDLEKCRYATGELGTALCARGYADTRAALSALSTLPFATDELEQTHRFLGSASQLLQGLCGKDGEFSDATREDLMTLSDTAETVAAQLMQLRTQIDDGALRYDVRERPLQNIVPEEQPTLLSASFAEMEQNFPETAALQTLAAPAAPKTVYADEAAARRAAGALLGIDPELFHLDYTYSDGSVALSRGSLTVRADAERVLGFADSRLVEEADVSEVRALRRAEEFLQRAGYENFALEEKKQSGNVLRLRYLGTVDGIVDLQSSLELAVALDTCSLYAYRAPERLPAEGCVWPLSAELAETALPSGLGIAAVRPVIYEDQGCYEYTCTDAHHEAKILVDASYAEQKAVSVTADPK